MYEIIEKGIKHKSFKNFTENREQADRSTIFNEGFRASFLDWNYLSLALIEIFSFNGIAIVLPHSWIILFDISSNS